MAQQAMQQTGGGQGGKGDAVERLLLSARAVIYEKPTSDAVVRMLKQQGPVAHNLAQTALFVLRALWEESKGSMAKVKDAIPPVAEQLILLLAELADAAGVDVTDEDIAQAKSIVAERLQKHLAAMTTPTEGQPQQPTGLLAAEMAG